MRYHVLLVNHIRTKTIVIRAKSKGAAAQRIDCFIQKSKERWFQSAILGAELSLDS